MKICQESPEFFDGHPFGLVGGLGSKPAVFGMRRFLGFRAMLYLYEMNWVGSQSGGTTRGGGW